ncbi:MAG: glycosyltransferase [Desulfovibrio sp.]|jgi:glycosyltransferase involved in cell wall biosynthesis|nr:glycosyltransferase [Desulfovibrio sp.]
MRYSIVTATLNASCFLPRTLNSVLAQRDCDCEIIVKDGASADGTVDILKKYGSRIIWSSSADNGLYDAWNQALNGGIHGDWVLFLGADDFLLSDTVLACCGRYLAALPPETAFTAGGLVLGRNGRPKTRIRNNLTDMYSLLLRGVGLPFPATFIRAGLFREQRFDASFKIAGDLEFTARLLTADNLAVVPHYVTFMEHGGLSDSPAHAELLLEEKKRVLRTHVIPKARMIAESCLRYLSDDVNGEPRPAQGFPVRSGQGTETLFSGRVPDVSFAERKP